MWRYWPTGGELDLAASGITNPAGGLIQVAAGNTVIVTRGLVANAGNIGLTGGAIDTNITPLHIARWV
jgi:hypothetical protein